MEFISNQSYHSYSYLIDPAVVLSLLFLLLVLLYWNGMRRYTVLRKLNLPGPRPLPYIGNTLEIRKYGGIINFQTECMKRYGKIFAMWTPNLSIVVAEPEMLKQITVKEFGKFTNRYPLRGVDREAKTLFFARDGNWKRIRNTLKPSFAATSVNLMAPFFERAINKLMDKLDVVGSTGKSVDILEWFSGMSLDAILSTCFGVDSDVQTDLNSKLLKEIRFGSHSAIEVILKIIPFGSYLAKFILAFKKRHPTTLEKLAKSTIHNRQQELSEGVSGRKDLLYLMLTAHETDGVQRLSEEEILAQAFLFLFIGHENTGNVLTLVAYHLAMNPDAQETLRKEIESAVQRNPDVCLDELVETIEYLDCVCSEAVRLEFPKKHSFINRECDKAVVINDVLFPAGAEVVINPWLLHHDPDAWPEVDKFNPERHRDLAKEARHPYQFLPFGAGPRQCIAKRFVLIEVKSTLLKLLRRFRFVRGADTPGKPTRQSKVHLLVELVEK